MTSLSEDQRHSAIIAGRSFGDIVASPGREPELGRPVGVAMSPTQGTARSVEALTDRVVGTLAPDLAAAKKRRVIEQ